ncbi:hypothetical protein IWX49DRAFT_557865 [Phyllosticta citricarpa]
MRWQVAKGCMRSAKWTTKVEAILQRDGDNKRRVSTNETMQTASLLPQSSIFDLDWSEQTGQRKVATRAGVRVRMRKGTKKIVEVRDEARRAGRFFQVRGGSRKTLFASAQVANLAQEASCTNLTQQQSYPRGLPLECPASLSLCLYPSPAAMGSSKKVSNQQKKRRRLSRNNLAAFKQASKTERVQAWMHKVQPNGNGGDVQQPPPQQQQQQQLERAFEAALAAALAVHEQLVALVSGGKEDVAKQLREVKDMDMVLAVFQKQVRDLGAQYLRCFAAKIEAFLNLQMFKVRQHLENVRVVED